MLGDPGQAVVSWGSAYHLVEKLSRSGLPRISEGTNKRENETITLESELKPAELLEREDLGLLSTQIFVKSTDRSSLEGWRMPVAPTPRNSTSSRAYSALSDTLSSLRVSKGL